MLDLRVIAVIVEPGERKGCVDEVGCEPFAGGAVACDHTLSLVGGNISEERFLEPAFRPAKPGLIAQQGCHLRWPLETFRCVRDRMSYSLFPGGIVCETEVPEPHKRKLLDQVRDAIRARHYSRRTEECYVGWIRRFIVFHGKRHPMQMGEAEITAFLSALAVKARVSASTQNQALSALLFLYRKVLKRELAWLDNVVRAKTPRRLPVVLTRDEVGAVLEQLHGTVRLMATLLYGSGLRLLECARLRIKDVDFNLNHIVVRAGKGNKDQVTLLPAVVKADLARHMERIRKLHEKDLEAGAGWVELPAALSRKYPNSGREWCWQWVFPATRIYIEPRTGKRRRHHLHESVLQRAVKEAIRRAGITKPASCHTF